MSVCGIDVSHKTFDMAIMKKGKMLEASSFNNNAKGYKALLKKLKKHKVSRVGLEATGYYHLDLALALNEEKSIKLMVINPRASHNFAKAMMQNNKTDAIDAKILAYFVERMDFVSWVAPREDILQLRACGRRIVSLSKDKAKAKNQLHAFSVTKGCPDIVIKDIKLSISQLEAQIDNMVGHALALIKKSSVLCNQYQLLTGIKGIGDKTAIKVIGEIGVLNEDMKAKQWVAHAGLYPRILQSGTSVNKKIGIGKNGNRYIREALYMGALSAAQWDPNIKGYYQHLINDNGLKKMQALCAVMRKILVSMHRMLKNNIPFNGALFYALPDVAN
jgi:transposase